MEDEIIKLMLTIWWYSLERIYKGNFAVKGNCV